MGDKELENIVAQFGSDAAAAAGNAGAAVAAPNEFAPHAGIANKVISEAIEVNNHVGDLSTIAAAPADAAHVAQAVTLGGFF